MGAALAAVLTNEGKSLKDRRECSEMVAEFYAVRDALEALSKAIRAEGKGRNKDKPLTEVEKALVNVWQAWDALEDVLLK